eukprot:6190206-Pleurochrysis_carterae.AAC.1
MHAARPTSSKWLTKPTVASARCPRRKVLKSGTAMRNLCFRHSIIEDDSGFKEDGSAFTTSVSSLS